MADHQETREALDAATSRRLARLADRPVDVSALEARLREQMDAEAAPVPRVLPWRRWLSPAAGLAAAIVLAVGLLGLVLQQAPSAAAAPVLELTRLHADLVDGRIPVTPVTTIADANAWIARQSAAAPALPTDLTGAQVQSCCLVSVRGELVAVALMDMEGRPVTLVVADAPDFGHAMGRTIERGGRELFTHTIGDLDMVMTRVGDRWLCVMAARPPTNATTGAAAPLPEDLLDLAAAVQF